jgi:tripartite-type tricarboxylate transporter receptor subunit TctC
VTGQVIELHRSEKIRLLAIATPARVPALPDVPTAIEAGLPDFVSQNLVGIWAPTGTPRQIVDRFSVATRLAMADEVFRSRLIAAGFEPSDDLSADRMGRAIAAQFALWTPIIRATGLKLE